MAAVNKLAFRFLIFVIVVAGLTYYYFAPLLKPSKYSNCVVVEQESDFIGERLKYSKAKEHVRMLTTKCAELDKSIDNGNGPKSGVVRWAECPQGPDCNEIAMF